MAGKAERVAKAGKTEGAMNDITNRVKVGHAERAHEQTLVEGEPRLWMVYGVAIVEATTRREATDKAIAGQLAEAWTVIDDVGGFYEPEPYDK